MQLGNESLYLTEDEEICNRSIPYISKEITINVREPLTKNEIASICLYIIALVTGTFGNALVIKHFAQGDTSNRPGSRFVIILAANDIVTSIWLPPSHINEILYYFAGIHHWPFGEVICYISSFYLTWLFTTPWLLLAISVERARAIYRPFANRLSAKFVIAISAVVFVGSCALHLKNVLKFEYVTNLKTYIDGTVYEYSTCESKMSYKELLIANFVTFSIGVWVPMILIALVYTLTFLKLKELAEITRNSSSQPSSAQLKKISRTFTTVILVFYICYLPATIVSTISSWKLYYFELNPKNDISRNDIEVISTAFTISHLLMYTNCSLNPVIYSKVHIRIYNRVKQIIIFFKHRCTLKAESNNCSRHLDTFVVSSTMHELKDRENQQRDHVFSNCGPELEVGLPRACTEQPCKNNKAELEIMPDLNHECSRHADQPQETAF